MYSITDYTVEIQNYIVILTDTNTNVTTQFKLKVQYVINRAQQENTLEVIKLTKHITKYSHFILLQIIQLK